MWLFLLISIAHNTSAKDDIVSTGVPDMMVDLKEVSFKTYNDERLIIKLNDKNHSQLKEVCFEHNSKSILLDSELTKSICSVNLNHVEMHRLTKVDKDGNTFFSNDLRIVIPFNDYYKDCQFPSNYDDLPFSDYELVIYLIEGKFKEVLVHNLTY